MTLFVDGKSNGVGGGGKTKFRVMVGFVVSSFSFGKRGEVLMIEAAQTILKDI